MIVDPSSSGDCRNFTGATAVTPNRLETKRATGRAITTIDDAIAAGTAAVRRAVASTTPYITLDSDGIVVAQSDGSAEHLPTRKREVYDITGAGDMVLAMIGLGAAAGIAAVRPGPAGQRGRRPGSRADRRRPHHAAANSGRSLWRRAVDDRQDSARSTSWSGTSRPAAGWASGSSSPTAASTSCTWATSPICSRPRAKGTASSWRSTATPACASSARARIGPSSANSSGPPCWPRWKRSITSPSSARRRRTPCWAG